MIWVDQTGGGGGGEPPLSSALPEADRVHANDWERLLGAYQFPPPEVDDFERALWLCFLSDF